MNATFELAERIADATDAELDGLVHQFWKALPGWVTGGSLSLADARFLFRAALDANSDTLIEIGTASGFSAAILCLAHARLRRGAAPRPARAVASYDCSAVWNRDRTRAVGDAAREMLPPAFLECIQWRNPHFAIQVRHDYPPDSVGFAFIDANHSHPWPTLDLMAILPALRPGASVVLHDINLPVIHPEYQTWGAKVLFDSAPGPKDASVDRPHPNIGRIRVPEDKVAFAEALGAILQLRPWEEKVNAVVLDALNLPKGR